MLQKLHNSVGSIAQPESSQEPVVREAAPSYGAGSWSGASTKRTSNIFGHHFPVI